MKPRRATPLFPSHPAPPPDCVYAEVDGAARGNPGPAAYGVVLRDSQGAVLARLADTIGETTNNVAEYHGLLAALDYAQAHGHRALKVRSDSELLVRQMRGEYKVRSADLKPLHERARALARTLDFFDITSVPREQNRHADRLANQALDRSRGRVERPAEISIEARYEKGVLKPARKLDLAEGTRVELTIRKK